MKAFNKILRLRPRQGGTATIEFALVASLFFLALLIGIMEMGRVLFYWNSAAETTRLGARIAVVCDLNDAVIKARMQMMLPILPLEKIAIGYEPEGCNVNTCRSVTVSILPGASIATFIPYVPLTLPLPPFSTTLPRESMRSAVDGMGNPMCD